MSISWTLATHATDTASGPGGSAAYSPTLGLWVAVGQTATVGNGHVLTSTNGTTWTQRSIPSSQQFSGVAWAPSLARFAAVSVFSTDVITSSDGVTWTLRTGSSGNSWQGLVWSPDLSLFVAVGGAGVDTFMTSPDGINWTDRAVGIQANSWKRVAWSPSLTLFAAVSTSGTNRVVTSANGTAWTYRTASEANQWSGIAWSPTLALFAAVARTGTHQVMTSPDGINWTNRTVTSGNWRDVAWDPQGAQFVAVDATNGLSMYSTDGITWTTVVVTNTTWITVSAAASAPSGGAPPFIATASTNTGSDIMAGGGPISSTTGNAGGGESLTINGSGVNGGFQAGCIVAISPHGAIASAHGTIDTATTQINPITGDLSFQYATNVNVVSSTQLTCTTPAGYKISDVIVVNPYVAATPNVAFWSDSGFTYYDPAISSILPSSSYGVGGITATITGTNLFGFDPRNNGGAGANLTQQILFTSSGFTGYATNVNVVNSTTITCTVPAHVVGQSTVVNVELYASVRLVGPDSRYHYTWSPNSTLTAAFTYLPLWWKLDLSPLTEIVGSDISGIEESFDLFPYQFEIYQIDEPDPFELGLDILFNAKLIFKGTTFNYVQSSAPDDTGWWVSTNDTFAGASNVVSHSIPKDVRGFSEVAILASDTDNNGIFGGSPGIAGVWKNKLIYSPGGYTVGTTSPTLRLFDGTFDRLVATIPNTSAGVVPKAVMSILVANNEIYLSTLDTGSTYADWSGRVFVFDVLSGVLSPVGAAFPAGHIPYSLAWHDGRLWCGTHRQNQGVSGRVYFIRPDNDTAWTQDYDLSTASVGSVASICSYKGLLYVGTTAAAGTFAKLLVRGVDNSYSTSDTGTGGTARTSNCYLAQAVFQSKLYASYWNNDTTAVSKIKSFDGTTWTTVYTGSGTTLVPFNAFPQDQTTLLAIGGGRHINGTLLSTTNGTSWSDYTAFLTQGLTNATGVPAYGVVVV